MSRICAIIQELESTEFDADFVTTAGAMGTDDEDDDERKSENGKVKTIHPSASLCPPVSEGQSVWCGHKSVVTDSSPCRGIEGVRSTPDRGSTPQGGGGG